MTSTFKIVMVGDGGVGKSTFIKRHRTGEFEKRYIATVGVEVSALTFNTNKGPVILNIWDCAGQEKFGLQKEHYVGAQAVVLMFDVTCRTSFKNIKHWADEVAKTVTEKVPVIACGNKVDCQERKVRPQHISQKTEYYEQYYDISAKSNYNYEKPFIYLIRRLMNDESIVFTFTEEEESVQLSSVEEDEDPEKELGLDNSLIIENFSLAVAKDARSSPQQIVKQVILDILNADKELESRGKGSIARTLMFHLKGLTSAYTHTS